MNKIIENISVHVVDFILLMKSLMVITIYAQCVFGRMIQYN